MGLASVRDTFADAPFTRIPRWQPVDTSTGSMSSVQVDVPADLIDAIDSGATPARTVLLAAFTKVLAAVTSDRDIVFGLRPTDADPVPCRMSVVSGPWQHLLTEADRAWSVSEGLVGLSAQTLREELRDGAPLFDAVLDITGDATEPNADVAVTVSVLRLPDGPKVRVCHRDDVIDNAQATRLAGYVVAALRWLVIKPDADQERQSLISLDELRLQLHTLAGPRLPLPDKRFHDLFADRAAETPDAVGLVADGREWTYGELDRGSNRIARSLLGRGLAPEDVVAIATQRSAQWLLALLGVFKAGGAYLPIEPDFPAERIARVLRRAECRFVLVEHEDAGNVVAAVDEIGTPVDVLTVTAALACDDDSAPGVTVEPDQLAYIYFTSGSTGEPKGAMCEHAGMLNHLLAKIDDLRLGPDDVVVQNAPQCFDISLWQLVAPLLAGGRSVIVGQDAILDTGRFVGELVDASASVLQVVPSYLELLLGGLDDEPRDLGRLRIVSVTGEAIKKELVQRWFDRYDIPLVNAYGATEASDDTTHEVLTGVPATDGVPLGRPVRNVQVYVLDEHLALVPLGSPGEIAFAGVSVGRGYVNDPDRTAHAFLRDPFTPEQRLYRTGDFGRWLPGGTLEFLGRRDEQVKIRGFRIELGELEDRMLRLPGVRDAAVVVEREVDSSGTLVAFYAADRTITAEALRDFLAGTLPHYMVPAYVHRLDSLPLTANGKIDKKALTTLGATLGHAGAAYAAPRTATERRIAAAWAEVLQLPLERIGRADHFFDRGGNSLSAVRLVVKLEREISLNDLQSNPVLADLATVLDGQATRSSDRLHLLAGEDGTAAIVCFPYAGGNAVNFQSLAAAVTGPFAVFGVELPGHDLSRDAEPLRDVGGIADEVTDEIERRTDVPVLLFGHAAGSAHALAVAIRLRQRGRRVLGVVLSAQPLPDETVLRSTIEDTKALRDNDVKALLSADGGYVELDDAQEERTDLIGAVYRHDVITAAEFFLPAAKLTARPTLDEPITVLLDEADPASADDEARAAWALFCPDVRVRRIAGGRYFPRTRPIETADLLADIALDALRKEDP